jgi:hypothetical protein
MARGLPSEPKNATVTVTEFVPVTFGLVMKTVVFHASPIAN